MEVLFAGCREKRSSYRAICRVSRGCCVSLLPQGEGDIGIKAKKACSD